jgi:hypothetical protein
MKRKKSMARARIGQSLVLVLKQNAFIVIDNKLYTQNNPTRT